MKKYIFTYQTKNLITGKTYIGVRSTNNLDDGYIGCGIHSEAKARAYSKLNKKTVLCHSVIRYGYNNFKREILSFWDTLEEAYKEEEFLVNDSWVKSRDNYNMTIGGKGGGGNHRKGGKHPQATITDEIATNIIEEYNNGERNISFLAKKYKCGYHTVSDLKRGRTFKHLSIKPRVYKKPIRFNKLSKG